MGQVQPFELRIPQEELDDLKIRLAHARWPEAETVVDWSQGVPLEALQALVDYWRDHYDWRRCEAMLNGWGQYRTELDGLAIHFIHIRSPEPNALPLIMTHGWPGSVVEFNKVIGPLTNPSAFGGAAEDAFDLVLPSLPGHGFSDKPSQAGWNIERTGRTWIQLMQRLGYRRWAAQGGDWGAVVTAFIGQQAPTGLLGIHLNTAFLSPAPRTGETAEEQEILRDLQYQNDYLNAYAKQQATRPQTIGYSLVDSPVGQAAWIYEKFYDWTDHDGSPETILSRDEMLDNIMLYWLPRAGASAARMYWESLMRLPYGRVPVPTGMSVFPGEKYRTSRRWAELDYPNLIHFSVAARGGHFAAFEQPNVFVDELRTTFRPLR